MEEPSYESLKGQLEQALKKVHDLEAKLHSLEKAQHPPSRRARTDSAPGSEMGVRELAGAAGAARDDSRPEVRIWMDGAFDMMHYGHMNAFRQGRALGTHLIVGVNSDETITACKGRPVCDERERVETVRGCQWVDEVVEGVPYIMNDEYLAYIIREYRIDYVVHGDDPCIVDGRDVYESAVKMGKYLTIPRTEGISTTDIVGRMLLMTRAHHSYPHAEPVGVRPPTHSLATYPPPPMSPTIDAAASQPALGADSADSADSSESEHESDREHDLRCATDNCCGIAAEERENGFGIAAEERENGCGIAAVERENGFGIAAEERENGCGIAAEERENGCGIAAEERENGFGVQGGTGHNRDKKFKLASGASERIKKGSAVQADGGGGVGGDRAVDSTSVQPDNTLSNMSSGSAGRSAGRSAEQDDAVSATGDAGTMGAVGGPTSTSVPFVRKSKFLTTSRILRLFGAGVKAPLPTDRVVYLAGAWDMFHAGHVETLELARQHGDYVIVGVHNDTIVNQQRGLNFPILNLHERVLSVLGCKWADDVLIDAPEEITRELLLTLKIDVVVRGRFLRDSSYGSPAASPTSSRNSSPTPSPGRSRGKDSETKQGQGKRQALVADEQGQGQGQGQGRGRARGWSMEEDSCYRVPRDMGILREVHSSMGMSVVDMVRRIQEQRERFAEKYQRKAKTESQYYQEKYNI